MPRLRRSAGCRTTLRALCEPCEARRLMAGMAAEDLGVALSDDRSTGGVPDPRMAAVGDVLYFAGRTADEGEELWRSDGTAAGTRMVTSIYYGTASSRPHWLTELGGVLYFVAGSDGNEGSLWRSDGTANGTWLVQGFINASDLTRVGDRLFFIGDTLSTGAELWTSDGTREGTRLAADVNPGSAGSRITSITDFNGRAFFRADDGAAITPHGHEPWVSDGTPAGTFLLKDINAGGASSSDPFLIARDERGRVAGGRLYFGATDGQNGYELWSTDGTPAGTTLAADLRPGGNNSHPSLAAVVGDVLYTFTHGTPPNQLFRTDARTGQTSQVTAFADDGNFARQPLYATPLPDGSGRFVFGAPDTISQGLTLWSSDGTPFGTQRVHGVKVEQMVRPAALGDAVYFAGSDLDNGSELWRTDGTLFGTLRVTDVAPGRGDAHPTRLTPAGDKLFFAAKPPAQPLDPGNLWVLKPRAASSVVGRHVFYNNSAFDGADPDITSADDNAIAPDKHGHPSVIDSLPTFASITSYARGINGVMIDITNLPDDVESLTGDDFEFGGDGTPPIAIDVWRGLGADASDRVVLTWPDYNPLTDPPTMAVGNGWLVLTVKATERTGLATPDTFYFGNLIGEIGDASPAPGWRVNALDLAAVKRGLNTNATLISPLDFNRDGRVNALDLSTVRRALNRSLPALPVVPIPAPPSEPAARRVAELVLL